MPKKGEKEGKTFFMEKNQGMIFGAPKKKKTLGNVTTKVKCQKLNDFLKNGKIPPPIKIPREIYINFFF